MVNSNKQEDDDDDDDNYDLIPLCSKFQWPMALLIPAPLASVTSNWSWPLSI